METIHLATSSKFIERKSLSHSQLIIDKFMEACLCLDAAVFEPYMHEYDVFEDKEKYRFLAHLHTVFTEHLHVAKNQYTVTVLESHCKGCVLGRPVKHFKVANIINNVVAFEFAFMIEVEHGILKDIYRCYDYNGCRTYRLDFGMDVSWDLLVKSEKEYRASRK